MRILAAVIGLLALSSGAQADDPYSYYVPWSGTTLYQEPAPLHQPSYNRPLTAITSDGFTTFSDGTTAITTDGYTTFSGGGSCVSSSGYTTCSGTSLGGPVETYIKAIGR